MNLRHLFTLSASAAAAMLPDGDNPLHPAAAAPSVRLQHGRSRSNRDVLSELRQLGRQGRPLAGRADGLWSLRPAPGGQGDPAAAPAAVRPGAVSAARSAVLVAGPGGVVRRPGGAGQPRRTPAPDPAAAAATAPTVLLSGSGRRCRCGRPPAWRQPDEHASSALQTGDSMTPPRQAWLRRHPRCGRHVTKCRRHVKKCRRQVTERSG